MSYLVAVKFANEEKAESTLVKLQGLQQMHLVDLEDAAIAVKKDGGKVKLIQTHNLTVASAIGGGFFGALIGLIFLNPLVGAAVGAASGAVSGALSDIGIDDEFMKSLGERLEPGNAALFVLVRSATPDRVIDALRPFEGELLQTSLSHTDETRLREALEAVRG